MKDIKAILTGIIKHEHLKDTHSALFISAGESNYQGEKFEAALRLALKKFGAVSIIIVDSLHEPKIQLGDGWLKLHQPIISSLEQELALSPGSVNIVKWDDILKHPEHSAEFTSLWTRFNAQKDTFFTAVKKSIEKFFARHHYDSKTFSLENPNVQLTAKHIVKKQQHLKY